MYSKHLNQMDRLPILHSKVTYCIKWVETDFRKHNCTEVLTFGILSTVEL